MSLLALRTSSPLRAAAQTPTADLAAELLIEAPPSSTAPAPEPTSTPAPLPTVNTEPTRHKVKQGDTLGAIAALYKSTVKDIADANGLPANAILQVGQELLIPVPGPSGGPGPTSTPAGGALMYSVQAGDTLFGLALRFGSQVDWILQANNLKAGDVLHIGQALLIPLSSNTPTPTPTEPPAPSPTPTMRSLSFRAPEPLSPANGSFVSSPDGILLSWTSTGTLVESQWYVVTVWGGEDKSPLVTHWTRSSSWRLPTEYRTAHAAPVDFTWQVQVRSGTPDGASEGLSLPSATRRFTWR